MNECTQCCQKGCQSGCKPRLWTAVLSGALVAVGLTFLFNLLTLGIGLSIYTHTSEGTYNLIISGYIWILIGTFVILFLAGMTTGRIKGRKKCCNTSRRHTGLVPGFLTWILSVIITLLLVTVIANASFSPLVKNSFLNLPTENNVALISEETGNEAAANRMGTKGEVSAKTESHRLGITTIATFVLFAMGALGCCFGAYCGLIDARRECQNKPSMTPTNPVPPKF